MHEDLEYLEYCKDKVIEKLAEYGFEPNPKKTKVIPITEEILFLGFYYRLTETGKIIMRLNPANVKQERKSAMPKLLYSSATSSLPDTFLITGWNW